MKSSALPAGESQDVGSLGPGSSINQLRYLKQVIIFQELPFFLVSKMRIFSRSVLPVPSIASCALIHSVLFSRMVPWLVFQPVCLDISTETAMSVGVLALSAALGEILVSLSGCLPGMVQTLCTL